MFSRRLRSAVLLPTALLLAASAVQLRVLLTATGVMVEYANSTVFSETTVNAFEMYWKPAIISAVFILAADLIFHVVLFQLPKIKEKRATKSKMKQMKQEVDDI